jgi:hypothetical protein
MDIMMPSHLLISENIVLRVEVKAGDAADLARRFVMSSSDVPFKSGSVLLDSRREDY